MSVLNFYRHMGRYVTYVLKETRVGPEGNTRSWPYVTKRGGKIKDFRTTRERFVECGGALLYDGCVEAYLYGFHVRKRIRHSRLRRVVRSCRAKHWFNYRVRTSGGIIFRRYRWKRRHIRQRKNSIRPDSYRVHSASSLPRIRVLRSRVPRARCDFQIAYYEKLHEVANGCCFHEIRCLRVSQSWDRCRAYYNRARNL